jgi:hypothetical protein
MYSTKMCTCHILEGQESWMNLNLVKIFVWITRREQCDSDRIKRRSVLYIMCMTLKKREIVRRFFGSAGMKSNSNSMNPR